MADKPVEDDQMQHSQSKESEEKQSSDELEAILATLPKCKGWGQSLPVPIQGSLDGSAQARLGAMVGVALYLAPLRPASLHLRQGGNYLAQSAGLRHHQEAPLRLR